MSAEAINVIVTIGGHNYTVDLIGDPDDVMFALSVGRAVSETLVTHGARVRKLEQQASAAECAPPPPEMPGLWTQPLSKHATCRICARAITWVAGVGAHIGVWMHDTPATPETRCGGAEPR